jgi:hypothetical protein
MVELARANSWMPVPSTGMTGYWALTMVDSDLGLLAEAWVAEGLDASRRAAIGDAHDRAWDLCQDKPEKAFQLVLEVLRRNHSNEILKVLAAGPLENILAKHGEAMIERVEAEAKSNPLFAKLLGGVWQNDMPEHIWNRVQKVWDRRGWDGIAEDNPSK